MQLLPKQDKKGASHNPRVVTKRHLKKVDLVLWVCCATVGLGSVLSAAAIVVGRRSEVSPSVSKVNRALEMTQYEPAGFLRLHVSDVVPLRLANGSNSSSFFSLRLSSCIVLSKCDPELPKSLGVKVWIKALVHVRLSQLAKLMILACISS